MPVQRKSTNNYYNSLQQMQSQKQVNNVCTIRLLTVTKQRLVLIRYTEKNKDKAKMDGFVPMNNSEQ
ncbi:hypothetical protein T03_15975 [Trichinella britovi]|uniref:Uncharacterized protein n=1 Tax=Trichinella britovi TaxID=45882 RepID=A0A0V1CS95_TRIBR|nr:hypothetical protein T03_15975 [Trichinella britovi]